MNSWKELVLTVFLAFLVFFLQDIEGKICTKKNHYCPNTTLNYDTSNEVVISEAERQLIRDVLSSQLLFNLSPNGKRFVADVLNRVNTDSSIEMFRYYIFAYRSLIYLSNPDEYPSICPTAEFINSSVSWPTNRDGPLTANALLKYAQRTRILCNALKVNSLLRLGCNNVPDYPSITMRCYNRGRVYQIEQALDLFGRSLPCYIQENLLNLYSSQKHTDNVLAAIFTMSLTPEIANIIQAHNQNILIETINLMLFNNVSVCCCSKRQARFEQLCSSNTAQVLGNVNALIKNTYLYDECATVPVI